MLNDDKYDYAKIGWPFLYETGQNIYRHELNRKRKYNPDLLQFEMEYHKKKNMAGLHLRMQTTENVALKIIEAIIPKNNYNYSP